MNHVEELVGNADPEGIKPLRLPVERIGVVVVQLHVAVGGEAAAVLGIGEAIDAGVAQFDDVHIELVAAAEADVGQRGRIPHLLHLYRPYTVEHRGGDIDVVGHAVAVVVGIVDRTRADERIVHLEVAGGGHLLQISRWPRQRLGQTSAIIALQVAQHGAGRAHDRRPADGDLRLLAVLGRHQFRVAHRLHPVNRGSQGIENTGPFGLVDQDGGMHVASGERQKQQPQEARSGGHYMGM